MKKIYKLVRSGEAARRLGDIIFAKIMPAELLALALTAAFSVFMITPAIAKCVRNAEADKCEYHIYLMLTTLTQGINAENGDENGYWHMLLASQPRELLAALDSQNSATARHGADAYYISRDSGSVTIYCSEHSEMGGKSVNISIPVPEVEFTLPTTPSFSELPLYK